MTMLFPNPCYNEVHYKGTAQGQVSNPCYNEMHYKGTAQGQVFSQKVSYDP